MLLKTGKGSHVSRNFIKSYKKMTLLPKIVMYAMGKESIPFVREAKSGQWETIFDQETNNLYSNIFGDLLDQLGYER